MPNRSLLTRFQQVQENHIFREANSCADALAKGGWLQQETFVLFNNLPSPDISAFVSNDANGVYYVRRYANTMPFTGTVACSSFIQWSSFSPKTKTSTSIQI